VVCRDFISLKIWDIRNPAKPLRSIPITDYMDKKLCELYEAESFFDKFNISQSPCGKYALTGAYTNMGHIIDLEGKFNVQLESAFGNKRGKTCSAKARDYINRKLQPFTDGPTLDLKKKVLLNCWHPKENIVALGSHNCIFLFNEEKKGLKDKKE
jgi:serine/threonine-protein phosphatase 2A regulatory subunit B